MTVIIILIIVSILVAGGFLVAFFWAVRSGQYDDTYSPSVRILFEDKKRIQKKIIAKTDICQHIFSYSAVRLSCLITFHSIAVVIS